MVLLPTFAFTAAAARHVTQFPWVRKMAAPEGVSNYFPPLSIITRETPGRLSLSDGEWGQLL